MNLPSSVFQAALRDVEASASDANAELFLKLMREECKRRGWVQRDVKDVGSWEYVGASNDVPGVETVPKQE